MPKRVTDYRQTLLESLTDSREAAHYLEAALEDSREMFLRALRDVAESRQMSKVAKDAGVAREALYRMLSESGNPTLATLSSILDVVGVQLKIAPKIVEDNAPAPGIEFRSDEVNRGNRSSTTAGAHDGYVREFVRTKRQTDQRIATQELLDVTNTPRKAPMRETSSATNVADTLNDFSNRGNTDGREYRYG